MSVLNARQLHNETSAILDEVSKGKTFQIVRNGKLVGVLRPADEPPAPAWEEIMSEVWVAQKQAQGKTPNPVLAERQRRRRLSPTPIARSWLPGSIQMMNSPKPSRRGSKLM
jgi:antitoxin (DNA-binding transcriptional repressor) of toxin-antitoxin stability system